MYNRNPMRMLTNCSSKFHTSFKLPTPLLMTHLMTAYNWCQRHLRKLVNCQFINPFHLLVIMEIMEIRILSRLLKGFHASQHTHTVEIVDVYECKLSVCQDPISNKRLIGQINHLRYIF